MLLMDFNMDSSFSLISGATISQFFIALTQYSGIALAVILSFLLTFSSSVKKSSILTNSSVSGALLPEIIWAYFSYNGSDNFSYLRVKAFISFSSSSSSSFFLSK